MEDSQNKAFKKLEDLKVWQKAKKLSVDVYKLSFSNEKIKRDFSFIDQLRRASLSVSLNIAEGYGREGNKEFIHFLSIAKGSLTELKTILIIGNEVGYFSNEEIKPFNEEVIEIEKLISGFSKYLRSSDYSGIKFKKVLKEPSIGYGFNEFEEHDVNPLQNTKITY